MCLTPSSYKYFEIIIIYNSCHLRSSVALPFPLSLPSTACVSVEIVTSLGLSQKV